MMLHEHFDCKVLILTVFTGAPDQEIKPSSAFTPDQSGPPTVLGPPVCTLLLQRGAFRGDKLKFKEKKEKNLKPT